MTEQTVAYKIFHTLFPVWMQNKFIWTDKHVQYTPGLLTGDTETDKAWANDTTIVRRTLAQIITLHDEGVRVQFERPKDYLIAYDLLNAHLARWAEIIENPVSGRVPPPVSELYAMDSYMREISYLALQQRNQQNAIARQNNKPGDDLLSQMFSRFGSTVPHTQAPILKEPEIPELTGRQSTNIQEAWNNSPWGKRGNSRHTR